MAILHISMHFCGLMAQGPGQEGAEGRRGCHEGGQGRRARTSMLQRPLRAIPSSTGMGDKEVCGHLVSVGPDT